jgi:hypothetical protein
MFIEKFCKGYLDYNVHIAALQKGPFQGRVVAVITLVSYLILPLPFGIYLLTKGASLFGKIKMNVPPTPEDKRVQAVKNETLIKPKEPIIQNQKTFADKNTKNVPCQNQTSSKLPDFELAREKLRIPIKDTYVFPENSIAFLLEMLVQHGLGSHDSPNDLSRQYIIYDKTEEFKKELKDPGNQLKTLAEKRFGSLEDPRYRRFCLALEGEKFKKEWAAALDVLSDKNRSMAYSEAILCRALYDLFNAADSEKGPVQK